MEDIVSLKFKAVLFGYVYTTDIVITNAQKTHGSKTEPLNRKDRKIMIRVEPNDSFISSQYGYYYDYALCWGTTYEQG